MTPKSFLCLALITLGLSSPARIVRHWSDDELMKASDLVVIATPLSTKDLNEGSSLGFGPPANFHGVETTFKVLDAVKGMPPNDRVILHHYLMDDLSVPNGPGLFMSPPDPTNKYILYLVADGTNRYAPVAGQLDPGISMQPPPTNGFFMFGMPSVPPMADADPSIRHLVQIHVPARLHATRHRDFIQIKTDELVITNLTVGTNMATGTQCDIKVYQDGKLLNLGSDSLQGGLADGGDDEKILLQFDKTVLPDKPLVVEIKTIYFETDEPAQHDWSPASGKKYQILHEQTFKLDVK